MTQDGDVLDRLQGLETQSAGLDVRMSGVERTLTVMSTKLDRLTDTLTATTSQPKFDPIVIVGFIKDFAILFGIVCGGIIYVANNVSAGRTTLLDHRITSIEQAIRKDVK